MAKTAINPNKPKTASPQKRETHDWKDVEITWTCSECGHKQKWSWAGISYPPHPFWCEQHHCVATHPESIEQRLQSLVVRRRNQATEEAYWADRGDHIAQVDFEEYFARYEAAQTALRKVRALILAQS